MTDDAGTYECQGRNVAGPSASSMTSSVQIRDPGKLTKRRNQLSRQIVLRFSAVISIYLALIFRQSLLYKNYYYAIV